MSLFAKQKDDNLANHKSQAEEKDGENNQVRNNESIWDVFRHSVKLSVLADDSFHDTKINTGMLKKQVFRG